VPNPALLLTAAALPDRAVECVPGPPRQVSWGVRRKRGDAMDTSKARAPSTALTITFLGLSLAICVALVGFLVAVVPRYRRAWDDAGQQVSPLAKFAVSLSVWAGDWWWVLALAAIPSLLLAGVALWVARRSAPAWVSWALLVLAAGVPSLLLLVVGAGLALG
jgi:hypothetical protein